MNKTARILEVEQREGKPLEDLLKIWYLEEHRTTVEIGEFIGLSDTTVGCYLSECGIQKRKNSEAELIKSGGKKPSAKELQELYIKEGLSPGQIGEKCNVSSSTIAIWLGEYKIPIRNKSEAELIKSGGKKPSAKELQELYIKEGLSPGQIGEKCNVSSSTIRNWLGEYEIPIRDLSEARLLLLGRKKPTPEELRELYLKQGLNLPDIAQKYNISLSSIRTWLKEVGIPLRTKRPMYTLEQATEAYVTYSSNAIIKGETPDPIETFFARYDPVTLQLAKGTPPLRTYLNHFRQQKLEERVV